MTLQALAAVTRRGSWTLSLLVCATGLAQAQEQVGVIGHNVPTAEEYLLHATVPVPRGEFWNSWTQEPFSVQLDNGTIVPTQVEVVSRYPDLDDGVDVMEVIAKVQRPSEAQPGDWVEYKLVEDQHATGAPLLDPLTDQLLSGAGDVQLVAHDLFGHPYRADLLADMRNGTAKVRKRGRLTLQESTHEVLMPVQAVTGPQATMPHLMGVHVYLTRYHGTPVVSLDLHVHNGLDGQLGVAADTVLDEIYFRDLSLEVPSGWRVLQSYESPSLGQMQTGDERQFAAAHPAPDWLRPGRRALDAAPGTLRAAPDAAPRGLRGRGPRAARLPPPRVLPTGHPTQRRAELVVVVHPHGALLRPARAHAPDAAPRCRAGASAPERSAGLLRGSRGDRLSRQLPDALRRARLGPPVERRLRRDHRRR